MLEKIFIKDYKNTDDPAVRTAYGNVAGGFGIFMNGLLGAMKLFIGLISHSVSVMADAVNNIADMATSILTIVGFKLAAKKPDHDHPYGYARYEYVCGFVIALFMLAMGCIFAKESIGKIFNPQELDINMVTYIILGLALVGKGILMLAYKKFAKAINSTTLEANVTDTRNDIISSGAILVSMIVMGIFKINLDGYLGLAVSIFVIISALGTLKEELEPIIGIIPTKEQVKEIEKKLASYDVVIGFHDLVLHNYGVNNDFVTVHVEVDASRDMLEIHDLIDNIENDFREELGLAMTIHMDPVVLGNPHLDEYRAKVAAALEKFDSELQFHDFRMVEGHTHTNLVFDVLVPVDKPYNENDLADYLKKNVESDTELHFVIQIDRPFC